MKNQLKEEHSASKAKDKKILSLAKNKTSESKSKPKWNSREAVQKMMDDDGALWIEHLFNNVRWPKAHVPGLTGLLSTALLHQEEFNMTMHLVAGVGKFAAVQFYPCMYNCYRTASSFASTAPYDPVWGGWHSFDNYPSMNLDFAYYRFSSLNVQLVNSGIAETRGCQLYMNNAQTPHQSQTWPKMRDAKTTDLVSTGSGTSAYNLVWIPMTMQSTSVYEDGATFFASGVSWKGTPSDSNHVLDTAISIFVFGPETASDEFVCNVRCGLNCVPYPDVADQHDTKRVIGSAASSEKAMVAALGKAKKDPSQHTPGIVNLGKRALSTVANAVLPPSMQGIAQTAISWGADAIGSLFSLNMPKEDRWKCHMYALAVGGHDCSPYHWNEARRRVQYAKVRKLALKLKNFDEFKQFFDTKFLPWKKKSDSILEEGDDDDEKSEDSTPVVTLKSGFDDPVLI